MLLLLFWRCLLALQQVSTDDVYWLQVQLNFQARRKP
jgi:hypothetical protein